jgi:hypothetical protein
MATPRQFAGKIVGGECDTAINARKTCVGRILEIAGGQGSALEALYAATHAILDDRWHPMVLDLSFCVSTH